MINVELTKNYTGFKIEGTFDDFYDLYDDIHNFIPNDYRDIFKEDMRLHILGFLYDLRHAYQGSRNIKTVDNELSEETKEYYGIDPSIKENIMYEFEYVVPELLTDILLFKYFVRIENKKLSEYDAHYYNVMAFFSKVLDALQEILTKNQMNKVRERFSEAHISEKCWLRQWYSIITIDYCKMTKNKRKKEIMHIIESLCEPYFNDNYHKIRKEVKEFVKENNCDETDVIYGEYPKEIEW